MDIIRCSPRSRRWLALGCDILEATIMIDSVNQVSGSAHARPVMALDEATYQPYWLYPQPPFLVP